MEKINNAAVSTAKVVLLDRNGKPWIPPTAEEIRHDLKAAEAYRSCGSWNFNSAYLRGGEILTPTGGKKK